MKSVLLATSFEGAVLTDITADEYVLKISLIIPPGKELADLLLILPNIKQELTAMDIKIGRTNGKEVELICGMRSLDDKITFHPTMLKTNTLEIHLPCAYGHIVLDFSNGSSCHMLNGGATRMGKTTLWLYLVTSLYLQNKESLSLHICTTKPEDFYPFKNIPRITINDTHPEVFSLLNNLITEKEKRKSLLQELGNVKDHTGVQKRYPQLYPHFHSIFVLIDEYGAYSDSKPIQELVTELVERGGSYNIHCLISAQRPDAKSVLPARVKANLLARICFTTADSNNSIVILDKEGAESLGKIPGRAILQDSDETIVQIPFLDEEECYKLMNPYRHVPRETITQGSANHASNKSEERPSNPELADKIQDMFTKSNRIDIL